MLASTAQAFPDYPPFTTDQLNQPLIPYEVAEVSVSEEKRLFSKRLPIFNSTKGTSAKPSSLLKPSSSLFTKPVLDLPPLALSTVSPPPNRRQGSLPAGAFDPLAIKKPVVNRTVAPTTIYPTASNLALPPLNQTAAVSSKQTVSEKTPLILIHGVGPDKGPYFNWAQFLQHAEASGLLNTHEVYFYHFDPKKPVKEIAAEFQHTLKTFLAQHPQKIQIIALSQGGLIARLAYEDPVVSHYTQTVVTIGTPFHGTPLATPQWMREVAKNMPTLSLFRLFLGTAYAKTQRELPNFNKDYCWDNVDRAMPPQVRSECDAPKELGPYEYPFITYASFFNADYQEEAFLKDLLGLPDTMMLKPEANHSPITSRSHRFELTADKIADVPTYPLKSGIIQPFSFNDGVTPIHSALWMTRWQSSQGQQFWPVIRRMRGTQMARLFRGLDHQNWMQGQTRTSEVSLMDWLNPDQPAKTGFDWVIDDIKRTTPNQTTVVNSDF